MEGEAREGKRPSQGHIAVHTELGEQRGPLTPEGSLPTPFTWANGSNQWTIRITGDGTIIVIPLLILFLEKNIKTFKMVYNAEIY